MNNSSSVEILIPTEDGGLELAENNSVKVRGCIKNPIPGPATIVLLLIQPDQCPVVKAVDVEIKEPTTTKEDKPIDENLCSLTVVGQKICSPRNK
jgi:hypothetical protein